MKKTVLSALLLGLLGLSGCATARVISPSGKPEVTITAPADIVVSAIVGRLLDKGSTIRSKSDSIIVAEHNATFAQNLLFGSKANPTAINRFTFNLVNVSSTTTRVVATIEIITNPGTGFEQRNDMSGSAKNVQDSLDEIKLKLESQNNQNR